MYDTQCVTRGHPPLQCVWPHETTATIGCVGVVMIDIGLDIRHARLICTSQGINHPTYFFCFDNSNLNYGGLIFNT